jgi:hypothetical protein
VHGGKISVHPSYTNRTDNLVPISGIDGRKLDAQNITALEPSLAGVVEPIPTRKPSAAYLIESLVSTLTSLVTIQSANDPLLGNAWLQHSKHCYICGVIHTRGLFKAANLFFALRVLNLNQCTR